MEFGHSLEQSREYCEKAMALMRERNIPPHPNNFTVWYSYYSTEHPDLKRALDILLDNKQEFTPERNAAVFRKFCAGPYEAIPLHLIAEKTETELAAVLAILEQAGTNAAEYGKTLETATGAFGTATRADDLRQILSRVLTQTRAMGQQSREVEKQLRQSWTEVGHLREELEGARREAMTDSLTSLANRKMFDFVLREAAMEAMESGEPLSLLLLDIDHFKRFNDTYGHSVGDHVLRLMAMVLRESVKGQDTAARYGGEEFAVILPRTELCDAAKLAENIRQRVASKTIIHRKTGEQLGKVNVSIGVAQFTFGEPIRRLIERSDQALYFAKRNGRNRVVSEEDVGQQVVFGS